MSKVMISLADAFLHEVDTLAHAEHRSRSELVREAIRTYVATRVEGHGVGGHREAQRAAARILKARIRWSQGQSAESLIRRMRQSRYGSA